MRVALTAHGPAVFGQAASAGVLHEGGGTARVVLEFVDGAAGIDLVGAGPGEVALRYEDIQRLGLELLAEERRDFESSPGYLVSGPPEAPWEWGAPSGGPRSATSGRRVWGTSLDGVTPSEQDDQWLETPPLRFASRPGPRVEFQHWIESVANGLSARFCAVRGEEELVRLDQFVAPTDAWVPYRKQLALDHLRPVRLLFWWESEGLATAVNGWYVDDLVISGLEKTVSFLDPTADDDGDGLSNANELARGSDPDNQDSDRDGVADGSDNCPVIVNPDQADLVTPNGIGDVCDDGDGDGGPTQPTRARQPSTLSRSTSTWTASGMPATTARTCTTSTRLMPTATGPATPARRTPGCPARPTPPSGFPTTSRATSLTPCGRSCTGSLPRSLP